MVSKKDLSLVVCIGVLIVLVAVGIYINVSRISRISDLESQIDALQETVSSLEEDRDQLQNRVAELLDKIDAMNSWEFIFQWPSGLRMEFNFSWVGENLSITAKINDFGDATGLGLFFDVNGDGEIRPFESGGIFYVNNKFHWGLLGENGFAIIPLIPPEYPSPYHTCTFELGVGYTYNISLPIREDLTNDLIHVCYMGSESVWVRFQFGSGV